MYRILKVSLTLALLLLAAPAVAQNAGNAAAEALFQEGRALLQDGKHDEACPKLAESQRLDPSTGTLIVLGICHEAQGKLATAWAELTTAEARGKREGREDREKLARERAAALRPRLSTLAIDVPPEVAATPGLEVKLDGAVTGSFGTAVPVDGGEHRIDATAPGKKPYSTIVTVKTESDAVRTSVPALVDAEPAAAAAPPVAQGESQPSDSSGAEEKPWPAMRSAALITAGVGVVALGVGSYLALDAKADYDDADKQCNGDVCPDAPFEATQDARAQGTIATVVFAVGGAAIVTGAALWFLAPSGDESAHASGRVRVERVGLGVQGVTVRGSF